MEKETLQKKAEFERNRIESTFESKTQFKQNVTSKTWLDILYPIINLISRHESYLNESVYPLLKSFAYKETSNDNGLNKTGEKLLYTQEFHNAFLISYKLFIIEVLTKENENTRLFNCTDALSNVVELIRFEERKQIINFLKEL
jgi:hypothetical protein